MKNYFVYKDEEVKRFNHVTVVKGSFKLKNSAETLLDEKFINLNALHNCVVYSNKEKEGRSKCDPKDTYNAKTGLIIASRKAELKANKETLSWVTEARKAAEEYLELLKDIEDKLDYKVGKTELDLIAFNKGE
jgi:hypothetical protein